MDREWFSSPEDDDPPPDGDDEDMLFCDGDDPEEATAIIPTADPGDCCEEWWNMAGTDGKGKVIHGARAHSDAAMQTLS